jgi:hypothetical protein
MNQSEQELEQNLIDRLTRLGYEPVKISNAAELTANLKTQLEKHNHTRFCPHAQVSNKRSRGSTTLGGARGGSRFYCSPDPYLH